MICSRPFVPSPVCAALMGRIRHPLLWSALCPTCGNGLTDPCDYVPDPTHCSSCCDCVSGDGLCLKCGADDEDGVSDWASGAVFSPDHMHRYLLWRRWVEGAPLLWIMLNPSTADPDPTLRRCIDYAKRWGFPAMEVVNLYASMSPEPADLRQAADPMSDDNLRHIDEAIARSGKVILGWGHHAKKVDIHPVLEILKRHGRTPYCLGVTKAGAPLHPLSLKKDLQPVIWKAA